MRKRGASESHLKTLPSRTLWQCTLQVKNTSAQMYGHNYISLLFNMFLFCSQSVTWSADLHWLALKLAHRWNAMDGKNAHKQEGLRRKGTSSSTHSMRRWQAPTTKSKKKMLHMYRWELREGTINTQKDHEVHYLADWSGQYRGR